MKVKNVFQSFKRAVIHSQQCQSKFNIRAILRFSFLFCLFLWGTMAAYLPTAYSYSDVSPHWNHIRTMVTDYQTIYISDDIERARQYDWIARHYDIVVGDGVVRNDTVYEIKRRNPGLKWYPYTINWTVVASTTYDYTTTYFYPHMQRWYSNHPEYNLEDAFVHDSNICPSNTPKTEACRIQFFVWDSYRWVINPADPGLQAYQAQRMRDIIAFNTYGGYEPDGIFFDEHETWSFNEAGLGPFNGRIREYTGITDQVGAYINDIITLLQIEKNALGPNKLIILNTNVLSREQDFQLTMAAGSAYLENANDPRRDGMSVRWDWVDRLLSNGASVSFNTYPNAADSNFPPGNYASGQDRMNIGWLADFYMVMPNSPDNLSFELQSVLYNRPFESFWYEAIGANVGIPLGPRSIYREGTDPNGRNYRVWVRDFENALVLSRPLEAWNYTTYDDTTGVTITLPSGDTYIPLNSDGTFGVPTNSITLRNVEAAILIKQSRLSYIYSSVPMLQFSSATYNVSEGAATATITVTRGGSSVGAVSVDYATSNGTGNNPAISGSDYTAASGTLNWADGDVASKTFTISIINDTAIENDETINLALSNPTGGAQLGSQSTATLTILDNDGPPILRFENSAYSADEGAGTVTIRVRRTGGSVGAVSVNYATSNGTGNNPAISGSDYTSASGTLNWADGDIATKSFTVSITNDNSVESSETVNITLSNQTNGAQLGSPSSVALTITDDDSATITPSNNNNTISGDTSIGGGGCGFIKNDDGKGPRAKGEGLTFAMMLILALAGIAIARRMPQLKNSTAYKPSN